MKPVATQGEFTERQTNYWPSYSEISPSARRAYLNWLASGRSHPEADIGYVFLFFYGIERRALVDANSDPEARSDMPLIAQELRRLLTIYGEKSGSFRNYAGSLLDWIELSTHPEKLYRRPVPAFSRTYEMPMYLRLALGQAAGDGVPLPAALALGWARLDPNIVLRKPATRCAEEFDTLFVQKYPETFGTGMVLPHNRTKLKFVYRPASAGFHGYGNIQLTFGDTTDISVVAAPARKLQQFVEDCTTAIEPYSRLVGRNPNARTSFEGLLLLPLNLWPQGARQALDELQKRVGSNYLVMPLRDLLALFGAKEALSKDRFQALAGVLESMSIALEPDILGGGKVPKPEEDIVLFQVPPDEQIERGTPSYQVALLTLQLSSAISRADGEFSDAEINHQREEISSWSHLTPGLQRRLLANLQLLASAPVSLATLKKKLEPLELSARETIATFMATVAQSDGTVTPDEVKVLQKVYKALGVDPKKVFSDLHAATVGTVPKGAKIEDVGFRLDPARIVVLQRDTEKVSALLAGIFKEEDLAPSVPTIEADTAPDEDMPSGFLGLDESHTRLARMLLSRPQWSRQELEDAAGDLELMLDGALERINEASFDLFDIPLIEGNDPMEVNSEIHEKIQA